MRGIHCDHTAVLPAVWMRGTLRPHCQWQCGRSVLAVCSQCVPIMQMSLAVCSQGTLRAHCGLLAAVWLRGGGSVIEGYTASTLRAVQQVYTAATLPVAGCSQCARRVIEGYTLRPPCCPQCGGGVAGFSFIAICCTDFKPAVEHRIMNILN